MTHRGDDGLGQTNTIGTHRGDGVKTRIDKIGHDWTHLVGTGLYIGTIKGLLTHREGDDSEQTTVSLDTLAHHRTPMPTSLLLSVKVENTIF